MIAALFTLTGSGAIIAGALLPWMTFYAGLQRLPGVSGAYGKGLLAVGIAVCVACAVQQWTRSRFLLQAMPLAGLLATTVAVALLRRAFDMREAPAMGMLIPAVGPGLWCIAAGGLAVAIAGAVRMRAQRVGDRYGRQR